MTTVADLQAFLGANVGGFVSGMHEAGAASKGLGSEVQSTSGHLKAHGVAAEEAGGKLDGLKGRAGGLMDTFKSMAPALMGIGAAMGAAFEVKGAISAFNDLAGSVKKFEMITGDTAESSSKLIFAFNEFGVPADKLTASMKKFEGAISGVVDAEDGGLMPAGKSMIELWKGLGVELEDSNGKMLPTSEIMLSLADKFKELGPGAEASALAVKTFGKAGLDMLPAMMQGREGLTEMMNEAQKLGHVLSQEEVDAFKKNTMASKEFHAALEGVQIQIGAALMPVMSKLTQAAVVLAVGFNQAVIPAIKEIVKWIGSNLVPIIKQAGEFIQTGMVIAFQALGTVIDYAKGPIRDFVGTLTGLVSHDFSTGHIVQGFKDIVFAVGELAYELGVPGPIIDALIGYYSKLIDVMAEFASGAAAGAVVIFQELAAGAEALWPTIKSLAEEGFGLLSQGIQKVVEYWNQLPPWAKTAIEIGLVAGAVVAVVGPFVALGAAVLYVVGRWDELNAKFPIIGQSIDKVKEALDVLVKQFEKFRNDVLPALQNVAVGIAAVVALFAMPFIAAGIAIEQTIREHFDAIMGIVNPALNLVKTVIETDLKMIRDVFSIAFALLRGDWSGAWDGLKTLVSDAFNGIKAVVKAEIDLTIGIIKNMPILILALVSNFVNVFNEIGQKMIEGLSAALTGGWADVRNAIWSMKDSAIGGLGNVADWLIGAGQDLVRGLVSGIESMAGWLTEKLRSWAGGVVGDVLGAFGINSPARTMIPVGEGILEGVGVGIDNGTAGVTSKLSSLSQNLVAAAVSTVAKVNAAMAQAGTASGGPMVTPGTWGNGTGSGTAAGPATSGIKPDKNGNIPGKAGYDVVQQPDGSYGYAVHNYGGTAPGLPIKQANGTYFTDSAANHPGQHWGGSGWVSDTVPVAAVSSGASATGGTSYEDAVKAAGGTVAAAGTNVGPLQTTVSLTIAGDVNITASDPTSWDTQVSALGYGVMSNLRARGLA